MGQAQALRCLPSCTMQYQQTLVNWVVGSHVPASVVLDTVLPLGLPPADFLTSISKDCMSALLRLGMVDYFSQTVLEQSVRQEPVWTSQSQTPFSLSCFSGSSFGVLATFWESKWLSEGWPTLGDPEPVHIL